MANISGRTNPVPMPCMHRPTRHISKEPAKPLIKAPIRNEQRANRVIWRAVNHFIRRLAKGRTKPITSMYATTSYCTMFSSTPKASESWGRAMLSAVSLYMPVKPPKYRHIILRYGCLTITRAWGREGFWDCVT